MSASILTLQDLADKIEPVLDLNTMDCFLDALALVCSSKADHIRENWQDEKYAKVWDKYAEETMRMSHRLFSSKSA